jgi:hypothetical protein
LSVFQKQAKAFFMINSLRFSHILPEFAGGMMQNNAKEFVFCHRANL